jgi:hypothetical protein
MSSSKRLHCSIDAWAIILSLTLALFVRIGLIKTVAW